MEKKSPRQQALGGYRIEWQAPDGLLVFLQGILDEDVLAAVREKIVGFFRDRFGVTGLKIKHEVIEQKRPKRKRLLTPEEKFKILEEQNPLVRELRDKLKLNIE